MVELNSAALAIRDHRIGDAIGFMNQHSYRVVDVLDNENFVFKKNKQYEE